MAVGAVGIVLPQLRPMNEIVSRIAHRVEILTQGAGQPDRHHPGERERDSFSSGPIFFCL